MDFNSAFLDASSFHARNTFVLINCRIFRSLFCGAAAAVTVVVVVVECFFVLLCFFSTLLHSFLYIYYLRILLLLCFSFVYSHCSRHGWLPECTIPFGLNVFKFHFVSIFFFRYNFIFLHINSMPGYFANHIEHALWAFFSVLISTVIHWRRNEQNEMRKTVVKKRISI